MLGRSYTQVNTKYDGGDRPRCRTIFFSSQVSVNLDQLSMTRGGVRAVKRARLESVCWGNSMVGPNPPITAIQTSLLVLSVACRTKNVPRIEIDDRDEILTSSQKIEQIQYRSSRRSLCGVHVALKLDEYWAWLDPAAIYTDFKKKTRVNYSPPCRPANKQRA